MMSETTVVDPKTGGLKGAKAERHDLLDVEALATLARVAGWGGAKYARLAEEQGQDPAVGEVNWRRGYAWSLGYAALQRHVQAWWGGEDLDPESGLPHLGHAMWHCMTLLAFIAGEGGTDNRPHQVLASLTDEAHAETPDTRGPQLAARAEALALLAEVQALPDDETR